MLACSTAVYMGDLFLMADICIILSNTAGIAQLSVGWLSPFRQTAEMTLCLGSLLWSALVGHGSSVMLKLWLHLNAQFHEDCPRAEPKTADEPVTFRTILKTLLHPHM